jgi:hypothetical protein
MLSQGDTFLGGGEVHGTDHLWIVINDPQTKNGVALIVNVSKIRTDAETTCVLQKGEHPFLTEAQGSYVRYHSAKQAKITDLDKLINLGKLKPHQPVSPALLAKLRAGAQASILLATELKALL